MGQGVQPFIDPIPEPAALMHVLDPLLGEAAEIGDVTLPRFAIDAYSLDQHRAQCTSVLPSGAHVAVCASG
jgi:hypothetical protein